MDLSELDGKLATLDDLKNSAQDVLVLRKTVLLRISEIVVPILIRLGETIKIECTPGIITHQLTERGWCCSGGTRMAFPEQIFDHLTIEQFQSQVVPQLDVLIEKIVGGTGAQQLKKLLKYLS